VLQPLSISIAIAALMVNIVLIALRIYLDRCVNVIDRELGDLGEECGVPGYEEVISEYGYGVKAGLTASYSSSRNEASPEALSALIRRSSTSYPLV